MNPSSKNTEFAGLLAKLLDECLSRSEWRRLEEFLVDDAELRQVYYDLTTTHALLNWRTAPVCGLLDGPVTSGDPPSAAADRRGLVAQAVDVMSYRNHPARFSILVAAISVVVLIVGMSWISGDFHRRFMAANRWAPQPGTQTDGIVARLTKVHDCHWKDKAGDLAVGSVLRADESLRLVQGFAEITFQSGARVVLRGPAEFTPQGTLRSRLEYGEISAQVDKTARGFAVETPLATITDLGTRFAAVSTDASLEVHVLQGRVTVEPAHEMNPNAKPLTLQAGDAVCCQSGQVPQRLAAEPSRFVFDLPRSSSLKRSAIGINFVPEAADPSLYGSSSSTYWNLAGGIQGVLKDGEVLDTNKQVVAEAVVQWTAGTRHPLVNQLNPTHPELNGMPLAYYLDCEASTAEDGIQVRIEVPADMVPFDLIVLSDRRNAAFEQLAELRVYEGSELDPKQLRFTHVVKDELLRNSTGELARSAQSEAAGNIVRFAGLNSSTVLLTAHGTLAGTPRAQINAIQIVPRHASSHRQSTDDSAGQHKQE